MKRTVRIAGCLLLVLAPLLTFRAFGQGENVESVLERYFNSLKVGDTKALLSLLAEPLLSERRELLENPAYPEYLRNIYKNATMAVKRATLEGENRRRVETEFRMNPGEPLVSRRFVLKVEQGSLKIAEERDELE